MGAQEMMIRTFNLRKIVYILMVFVLAYLGLGLGFHIMWNNALDACREARMAKGEFVEPEIFGNALGAIFDITSWPVYSWANIYHFGNPFSTPCSR